MPPVVDAEKCDACGSCIEVCPANVLEIKSKKCVVANADACIECRACEAACPNNAISFP
ncbi:MAG: 4Fe-4S binding protein [Candidatus Hodarchaeaceae archaeon]|nr:4Fe-4S binding protein [Candidatus Hodarchaeaceae archaeon]